MEMVTEVTTRLSIPAANHAHGGRIFALPVRRIGSEQEEPKMVAICVREGNSRRK